MGKRDRTARVKFVLMIALLSGAAVLALFVGGCAADKAPSFSIKAATPTATPTPSPLSLTILHTNDTWGYLWPCG